MKTHFAFIAVIGACLMSSQSVAAEPPSAFGSGFDVHDSYRPLPLEEITPKNMPKWTWVAWSALRNAAEKFRSP